MLNGCLRCAQEYADLKSMKEQVLQDKASIEAVIAELDQKKVQALQGRRSESDLERRERMAKELGLSLLKVCRATPPPAAARVTA